MEDITYMRKFPRKPVYEFFKRIFDILISAVALILSAVPIAICAVLIKLEDGGPVFYKQARLGKDGRLFEIYKIRSMKVDSEKNGAVVAKKDDERLTTTGRFIRKRKIDELPQFMNILMGDMSFIGPRPERPSIAERYLKSVGDFNDRLFVKPGLTGYAQVIAPYDVRPGRKIQYDSYYINKRNIFMDIGIFLKTFGVVLKGETFRQDEENEKSIQY